MALDTKEIPDTPPPITAEEIRDHEVMEKLLATQPELQEKGLGHAVSRAWNNFKFTKEDWANSVVFGALFGTTFGALGWGIGSGLELMGLPSFHLPQLCGAFGLSLGAHSAVMHPFADMTRDFYTKCKEGLSEAQEHNKALGYLRDRVNAIKVYKKNFFENGLPGETDFSIPVSHAGLEAETAAADYAPPRPRILDSILSGKSDGRGMDAVMAEKKREALGEMSWVERTTRGPASTPTTPAL